MSDLDVETILVVVTGVTVLLAVIMVGFGTQRAYPGFGYWTTSQAIIAVACVVLADRGHFHEAVLAIVIPGMVLVAETLRLEGVRRFFGRQRSDYLLLAVPAVAVGLFAAFTYAVDSVSARVIVITGATMLLFWAMAVAILRKALGRSKHSYRIFGSVFALYGAFLLAYGIVWSTRPERAPFESMGRANLAFFILAVLFEITWVVIFVTMNVGRTESSLEAAKEAAETRGSQLARLLAFMPDATFAVDEKHKVTAWNKAVEELTGVTADEVVGRPFDETARPALGDSAATLIDLTLDPERADIPLEFQELRRNEGKLSFESEVELPGWPGRKRHLWFTVTRLHDANDRVCGAVESIRDISTRENAERIIRQREEQYRKLFELNFDGILVTAPGGAIQDANPAACKMLGMTKEEICEAGPTGIIKMDAEAWERLESGPPLGRDIAQFDLVRKDGSTFPAECMTVVYSDAMGVLRGFVVFRDISERVEAQSVLLESEARLLQAQAVAHVGNWEIDLGARSIWLSPEALRIYGLPQTSSYSALDLEGIDEYVEDPVTVTSVLKKMAEEGGAYDGEFQIRRVDDHVLRTVHVKGEAVAGEQGAPSKLVGVVQDITELREIENALRLTQHTVDHAGDQIFWMDRNGHLVFVSDSMCEQLGYTREELLGMTLFDLDPTLQLTGSIHPSQWWEAVKRQGSVYQEAVHRTKDGRDIPMEACINYGVQDGQEYYFVFARDISRRKEMEESLRLIQLPDHNAADQAFWVSPEGRVVFASDSTCRSLGYARDELLNMTIYDIDPLLSKDWRAVWEKTVQRGSHRQEAVYRTKAGKDIPVEVNARHLQEGDTEYALILAREIGDRERPKEALAESEDTARQSTTMEAIGRLAGGIAHDFNNLLTAIMGYGNLILEDEQVQGLPIKKDVEEVRAAAERASALTQKILAFSRRQALQPRVIAVDALLSDMEPRLRDVLGMDIDLVYLLGADAGFVEVDPAQLEEALTHLAMNARDAMPDGGRFILETKNADVSEEYCDLYPDLHPGSYVLLSLSDTGVGMDPDTMGHVFEPFFTTKSPASGSGLGLSMVYGVIRQSGGFVNVYSEVGKGTTFKVYLPSVPEPEAAQAAPIDVATAQVVGGAETILVVEDEAPLRRLVARVLGALGYKVFVAGSGPEALELLDDLDVPPDLLLTDVVLPGGMQGNDVASAFAARMPDLPVLYVSGHARDAIVHSGRLDEGVDFLGKPFTPDALAIKVRQVLDAHR